jgi:hypothetical protein
MACSFDPNTKRLNILCLILKNIAGNMPKPKDMGLIYKINSLGYLTGILNAII